MSKMISRCCFKAIVAFTSNTVEKDGKKIQVCPDCGTDITAQVAEYAEKAKKCRR